MSESSALIAASEAPITLEDLRHKAMAIREEVKVEVREQVTTRRNQIVVVGVVAVIAVISIAYFAGSMAGRRATETQTY
jgi:hypothetical protein